MSTTWKTKFEKELQTAKEARKNGNEGMARVCARRAAGELVRAYFQRQGLLLAKPSALHALKTLSQSGQVSEKVREIASHFVWQITPEHLLPGDADLIAEAQWLAWELLREAE